MSEAQMSEQRDILERLRSYHYAVFNSDDAEEAADEIERLRHDIERHIKIAADLATENETIRYQLVRSDAAIKATLVIVEREWDFPGAHPHRAAVLRDLKAALSDEERSQP